MRKPLTNAINVKSVKEEIQENSILFPLSGIEKSKEKTSKELTATMDPLIKSSSTKEPSLNKASTKETPLNKAPTTDKPLLGKNLSTTPRPSNQIKEKTSSLGKTLINQTPSHSTNSIY